MGRTPGHPPSGGKMQTEMRLKPTILKISVLIILMVMPISFRGPGFPPFEALGQEAGTTGTIGGEERKQADVEPGKSEAASTPEKPTKKETPFVPSEKIEADQEVDFPYDI